MTASTVDPLVEALGADIDRTLDDLVGRGRPVALLNFPNHGNPGDPAIWLGELAALGRIGAHIGYQASWDSYDPERLRSEVPEGPILLNGGGNLGDLHPGQQQTRERVLDDFPKRRVIQLPQSVHFDDPANLDRMRRLCSRHEDLVVLLRDRASHELAASHFDADCRLCPDMAFALGPLTRPEPDARRVDLLWLLRTDAEARAADPFDLPESALHGESDAPPGDVLVTDWWPPKPGERVGKPWLADQVNRHLGRMLRQPGRARGQLWRSYVRTFEPLAHAWVERGARILVQGDVVITDRLHGHVFCLLLGIPHVAMDNTTGKVRAMVETYTGASPLTHWAEEADEALEIARGLRRTGPTT